MSSDKLRDECDEWLATHAPISFICDAQWKDDVDSLVRFARQQQAVGVRMALSHVSSPYWYRELEAKAKEMEA